MNQNPFKPRLNKITMSKIIAILILIILIAALGFFSYGIYNKIPQGTKEFFILQPDAKIPENTSKELTMFMPNMRFATNSISYFFQDCDEERRSKVLEAFELVSEKTKVIQFYEATYVPMIVIYCSQQKGERRNNSFVAGEGGPNKVVDLDLYPLIIDGKIYLYDSRSRDNCEYPVIELHELMHVFGFDHLANDSTILYPYVDCSQRITNDIVNKLKELYSIDAKSDLIIRNLSASTSGRYLNFDIVVSNRGLIKTENTTIEIYDTKGKVGNFSIGNIDSGVSQTLSIKNLALPIRQITDLTFKTATTTPEYFYDNNEITAQVKN